MPPLAVFFALDGVLVDFQGDAGTVSVLPGARALLDDLDARGIPAAVVTNTASTIARPLLESLDVVPHALVGGDDVRNPTPAPDLIFRACEVLDVEPWDVLVVGNSVADQRAAGAAGALFAGIHGVAGNFTIESLSEVLSIVEGNHA